MKRSKRSTLEILKDLLKMYKSHVAVYNEAANIIRGATLQCLFSRLAQTGKNCEEELSVEVKKHGGTFIDLNEYSNEVKIEWMNLRTAIATNDGKAIFDSCEFEERMFGKVYEEIFRQTRKDLDLDLLRRQYSLIKEDLSKIRNLRKAFIRA